MLKLCNDKEISLMTPTDLGGEEIYFLSGDVRNPSQLGPGAEECCQPQRTCRPTPHTWGEDRERDRG